MKKILLFAAAGVMSCTAALGQWNSDPATNLVVWPEGESYYTTQMDVAPNGNTWLAASRPLTDGVTVSLQLIDSTGNLLFEEPLTVSQYKARTWVSVGDILYVDRDGNAIIAVTDCRNDPEAGEYGYESYTVYKVSQTGELLWGKEGISLDGENVYDLVAAMRITQIADGSYIFAWMHNHKENTNMMSIKMQHVSADGEILWDVNETCLHDASGKVAYMYPYVVDAGNNQFLLLWAQGSNQDIYVRKIDFDGTSVWSEDTRIYRSGWGSIPIWTLIDVKPSGDGGLIMSWNDDRNFTNIESAYLTYVKPNGEIGFMAGEEGQKLGYSGWRALSVRCNYDPKSDCFYAMWYECNSGQSWNRVVAQRVSRDGELLWSEEGLELKPMELTNYGYFSVQNGIDDEMAFFYMRNYAGSFGDVEAFVTTVNVNDTTVRRESEFTKSTRVSEKAGLTTTRMVDGKYWIAKWNDGGRVEDEVKVDRLMMQRINNDFTLGNPNADDAVVDVKAANTTFVALASLVDGEAMFATSMSQATPATLTIYNVNGAIVATPFNGVLAAGKQYIEWTADVPAGIYLATLATPQGVETVKLLVK
ncbi:MAG: T9SS type A sorting domain-containing protein [Bacteroidaceae bacterium]|nr:T9SS type A sorting domain-containing protein [Bacteroidaceae bacterium]